MLTTLIDCTSLLGKVLLPLLDACPYFDNYYHDQVNWAIMATNNYQGKERNLRGCTLSREMLLAHVILQKMVFVYSSVGPCGVL